VRRGRATGGRALQPVRRPAWTGGLQAAPRRRADGPGAAPGGRAGPGTGGVSMQVTVTVNGTEYTRDVDTRLLLVHFLRDCLGLTGTHWGCDTSNCGVCTVWLDGTPVKSCTVLTVMAHGREVRTVEGLAPDGELDP